MAGAQPAMFASGIGGVLVPVSIVNAINRAAIPLTFDSGDYDPLLQWIGNRRMVLIGEASHGTHDFYRERALITRRLIEEKGVQRCCD